MNKKNANNFFERKNELHLISQGLSNYNNLIIQGLPGIGKTTLVKYFIELHKQDYDIINYFYGYEIELQKNKLRFLKNSFENNDVKRNLTIIDEFEGILSEEVKRNALELLLEGRKYGNKTILVTRSINQIENRLLSNASLLSLNGFTSFEIEKYIIKHFSDNENFKTNDLIKLTKYLKGSPLAINIMFEYLKNNNTNIDSITNLFKKNITYEGLIFNKDGLLVPENSPNEKKIITDVSLVNKNLIDKVKRNSRLIYDLSPRDFEKLVAELLEKKGYNVTLTKATKDGGKDLFIAENSILGNFLFYVECKRYRRDFPVGVKLIRELYGTVMADRATAGILVTSSYFSPEAKLFTEKIKHQVSLIDFINLSKWIAEIKR